MSYKKIIRLLTAAVAAAALAGTPVAFAEDSSNKWEWTIAPYLWMAGIDGDVTIGGQTADVDISFSDILDNLDLAGMLQIEARKRRFGFFAQPNYIKVSDKSTIQGIQADFENKTWIVELGGFYRIGEWGSDRPGSLDLLLGARYWNISNKVDVLIPVAGVAVDRKKDRTLTDPIVGLRLGTYLTERLSFQVRGDAGGFDISSNTSRFSWQALALLGYDVSDTVVVAGGYRVLAVDTRDEKLLFTDEVDLTFDGPVLAVAFRF